MKPVVLQLIDSFEQGGSESQAVQLSRLLHESGRFRVQLACLSPEGPLRMEVQRAGLTDIPSFPLTAFYDLNAFRQLRRFVSYLRDLKVAVLHTHDFYTNVFGMFGGALARVPVRIASRRETIGMRSGSQQKVQSLAYSLSHQVVANCKAVKSQLIAEGLHEDKISVIYNGLDSHRFSSSPDCRNSAYATLNIPQLQQRPIVTMVANMRLEVKDHSMFLRMARRVVDEIPETAFLLAGEGKLLSRVRGEAEGLGLGSHVFFLGRCEHLQELLAVSDVCVLSSKSEGFSNAILEYMAAARTVVTTDVGGARESVVNGETGYIVSTGNDRAMAEKIVVLLREPETSNKMGQAGRRVVEQKFSCEEQLRNTVALYELLLCRKEKELPTGVKGTRQESA